LIKRKIEPKTRTAKVRGNVYLRTKGGNGHLEKQQKQQGGGNENILTMQKKKKSTGRGGNFGGGKVWFRFPKVAHARKSETSFITRQKRGGGRLGRSPPRGANTQGNAAPRKGKKAVWPVTKKRGVPVKGMAKEGGAKGSKRQKGPAQSRSRRIHGAKSETDG